MALDPELLKRIQAYYAPQGGSGWSPNMQSPYQEGGQVFQQDGGFVYNYDPTKQQAGQDKFNVFNQDGTFSNEGTFKTDDAAETFMMMLAAAGAMGMLPGGLLSGTFGQGTMAAQAGLEAGAGAGAGAYGASAGALESGITGAGAGGATPGVTYAGGVAPGAGGLGTMAPLATIEGPMSSSLLADSLTTMGAGSGLGSVLGGAAGLLGPAATLLGAAAGGQGQKTSTSTERKTDPRVDPYLFGNNGQPGLLQMTYDKLAGQMKPGGLQGYDDMQRVGQGLLNAPAAGNGFSLFAGRR